MKVEHFKITGTSHYVDNIMSIVSVNSNYELSASEIKSLYDEGERIPEYILKDSKVELIPEPENEFDKNAVKVLLGGAHVGYIKKGSCSHVKNLLADSTAKPFLESFGVGRYKIIYDGKVEKDSYNSPFIKIGIQVGAREVKAAPQEPNLVPEPERKSFSLNPKTAAKLYKIAAVLWILFGFLELFLNPILAIFGFCAAGLCFYFSKGKKK